MASDTPYIPPSICRTIATTSGHPQLLLNQNLGCNGDAPRASKRCKLSVVRDSDDVSQNSTHDTSNLVAKYWLNGSSSITGPILPQGELQGSISHPYLTQRHDLQFCPVFNPSDPGVSDLQVANTSLPSSRVNHRSPAQASEVDLVCYGAISSTDWLQPPTSTFAPQDAVWAGGPDIVLASSQHVQLSDRAVKLFQSLNQAQLTLHFSLRSQHAPNVTKAENTPPRKLVAIVYGQRQIADQVGDWLASIRIYLQRPSGCKLNVLYHNPQKLTHSSATLCMTSSLPGIVHSHHEAPQSNKFAINELYSTQNFLPAPQPASLRTRLHKHQREALAFMLSRESGWNLSDQNHTRDLWRSSLDAFGKQKFVDVLAEKSYFRSPPEFRGGLLADEMGLGKTCSMLALLASEISPSVLLDPNLTDKVKLVEKPTLIVVPLPLLQVWEGQIDLHFEPASVRVITYYGSSKKIYTTFDQVNIVLTTYDTVSQEWRRRKSCPDMGDSTHAQLPRDYPILLQRWHRIVLDEAHIIKNKDTAVAKAVSTLKGERRWCITGTPVQNRSSDLYSLLRFLQVYPYNDYKTFDQTFIRPWKNNDAKVLPKLQYMMNTLAIRRPRTVISLPEKEDIVVPVQLTADERSAYAKIQRGFADIVNAALETDNNSTSLYLNALQRINDLRYVCNHGLAPDRRKNRSQLVTPDGMDSLKCELDVLFSEEDPKTCLTCGQLLTERSIDVGEYLQPTRASQVDSGRCGSCASSYPSPSVKSSPGASSPFTFDSPQFPEPSSQCLVSSKILALLNEVIDLPTAEKCAVFSFWTTTLKSISEVLTRNNVPHLRYDGSMSRTKRDGILTKFRLAPASSVKVILVSISCGGQGLDLTTANHAYLVEPQWNPMVEEQAVSRVYRLGQQKPVRLCRLVVQDSWEQRIVDLQQKKRKLAELIVDRAKLADNLESGGIEGDITATSNVKTLLKWLKDLVC